MNNPSLSKYLRNNLDCNKDKQKVTNIHSKMGLKLRKQAAKV